MTDETQSLSPPPHPYRRRRCPHGRLLACLLLPGGRHDLSARQPPAARAPQGIPSKDRLLGHWGASPGLSFMYVHLNRIIREHNQEAIFMAGPGHGAPAGAGSGSFWKEGLVDLP